MEKSRQEQDLNLSEILNEQEIPEDHRSGYVGILGKPNVGKSTLLNAILGEKIAIVTRKAQTTRDQILGIHNVQDTAQILFYDTPGIHSPKHKLGEYMVDRVERTLEDIDIALFLVDARNDPGSEDRILASMLNESHQNIPVLLVLNKIDAVEDDLLTARQKRYEDLLAFTEVVRISALQGENIPALESRIIAHLPSGPPYYPKNQLTDIQERKIAAELIRKQILVHLSQEVPHSVAVQIEEFTYGEELLEIRANIYVERESQKGIVIGSGGSMTKRIGKSARGELQEFFGKQVYLDLWVKVRKNWRKDEQKMKWMGYDASN